MTSSQMNLVDSDSFALQTAVTVCPDLVGVCPSRGRRLGRLGEQLKEAQEFKTHLLATGVANTSVVVSVELIAET